MAVFMVAAASPREGLAAVKSRSRWFRIVDWDMVALNEQFRSEGSMLRRLFTRRKQREAEAFSTVRDHWSAYIEAKPRSPLLPRTWNGDV